LPNDLFDRGFGRFGKWANGRFGFGADFAAFASPENNDLKSPISHLGANGSRVHRSNSSEIAELCARQAEVAALPNSESSTPNRELG
jgi:hypothetical protein